MKPKYKDLKGDDLIKAIQADCAREHAKRFRVSWWASKKGWSLLPEANLYLTPDYERNRVHSLCLRLGFLTGKLSLQFRLRQNNPYQS